MRVTILPYRLSHTDQGPKGRGQYDGQGMYCGLSTAPEVFLILTTQLYLKYTWSIPEVPSLKYSCLNTPKQQYFMLLTSGG